MREKATLKCKVRKVKNFEIFRAGWSRIAVGHQKGEHHVTINSIKSYDANFSAARHEVKTLRCHVPPGRMKNEQAPPEQVQELAAVQAQPPHYEGKVSAFATQAKVEWKAGKYFGEKGHA